MSNSDGSTSMSFGNSKGTSAASTFTIEMDDPFDDSALLANALVDPMWQDSHGNSALMLAASDNRILHVKEILTMAAERGTLWQVLNMRNNEGFNALQMAIRSGSDMCAMLITRFAKEYYKSKPHLRGMSFTRSASNDTNEADIMIELDEAPSAAVPFSSRRPFILEAPPRPLSRDKISNNLKRIPSEEYVRTMNRTGRPLHYKFTQRTISGESFSPLPSPSSSVSTPTENKSISVGDKLRSIFSSKKHVNAESNRPQEYKKNDEENHLLGGKPLAPSTNVSPDQKVLAEEVFRSPWPAARPTRLPPLANLRRRTTSETRTKLGQEL